MSLSWCKEETFTVYTEGSETEKIRNYGTLRKNMFLELRGLSA